MRIIIPSLPFLFFFENYGVLLPFLLHACVLRCEMPSCFTWRGKIDQLRPRKLRRYVGVRRSL